MDSLKISREFYDYLGAQGLANNSSEDWDVACIENVDRYLQGHDEVLDLGCGYGRLSIPLAQRGYKVTAIDISPVLIDKARALASEASVNVRFDVGSMTGLSYKSNSFDAVISIWSSFNELLEANEQRAAVSEIYRVLRVGGIAVIDSFPPEKASADELMNGQRYGPDGKISAGIKLDNHSNPDFHHDKESIGQLCRIMGIVDWRLQLEPWGERIRQVVTLKK